MEQPKDYREVMDSVFAKLVPGGTLNAGAKQLKTAATLSAYENKKKLTLSDFVVTVFAATS